MLSVLIISLLLLFIGLGYYKSYLNPMTLMGFIWTIESVSLLLSIDLYYPISSNTYAIIGIGLISFMFGCFASTKRSFNKVKQYNERDYSLILTVKQNCELSLNYNIIFFLSISSILVLLPEAIQNYRMIQAGFDFTDIRTNYSNGVSAVTGILAVYRNYISKPFCLLIYPITAIDFLLGSRRKWLIVVTAAITLINMMYQGGRLPILYLVIHLFVIYVLYRRVIVLSKMQKIFVVVLIFLSFVLVSFVTDQRGGKSMQETFSIYTGGCIPLFDNYLRLLYTTPNTFGLASFSGLINSIIAILGNFGLNLPDFMYGVNKALNTEATIYIGPDIKMNAYVTLFYCFFLDGGYVGVIVLMFLYGYYSTYFFYKALLLRNFKWVLIYSIICQSIMFSMVRFQFSTAPYILALFLIPFLMKKKYN